MRWSSLSHVAHGHAGTIARARDCEGRRGDCVGDHQRAEQSAHEVVLVLRMSFIDGLSQNEIAEVLGLPLEIVKFRMRLAFEKLCGTTDSQSYAKDEPAAKH
jgi:hypothetical protein